MHWLSGFHFNLAKAASKWHGRQRHADSSLVLGNKQSGKDVLWILDGPGDFIFGPIGMNLLAEQLKCLFGPYGSI